MQDTEYDNIKYQQTHYGIYCIECVKTHLKYIGQTYENFYRRWIFHKWSLKNNRHSNTYLQNSYNKYGSENFKFYTIESFDIYCKDTIRKETLDELEKYYIEKYNTFECGFNLTTGGERCTMRPLSEEAKRKIGEKNKINMLGKKHSEETKKLMSISHKGKPKTELHKKHLSMAKKGKPISSEHREKCRIANQGSKQKTAKYNEDLIEQIRIDYMNGIGLSKLSDKYDICKGTMAGIIYHTRWKHVVPNGWDEFMKSKER